MKKLLLLGTILMSTLIYAQNEIQIPSKVNVQEKNVILNSVERPGFSMMLNGEPKDILKSFASYLETKIKLDVKIKSGKIIGEDLMNPTISDKHFNIYAICNETKNGNELVYFMSFGTDVYVNAAKYPNEAIISNNLVENFGKFYYKNLVEKQINESTKIMNAANDQLTDVNNEISDIAKDKNKASIKIEKLEKKNLKAEEKIRKIESDLTENEKEIEAYQKEIESLNTKNETLMETKKAASEKASTAKSTLNGLNEKKVTFQ